MPAEDETIGEIIQRVTVDAYGEEGYTSFAQAFEDEIDFPLDANLVGIGVEVRSVDFDGDERRGLLAVITRDGETHRVTSSTSYSRPVLRFRSRGPTGDGRHQLKRRSAISQDDRPARRNCHQNSLVHPCSRRARHPH